MYELFKDLCAESSYEEVQEWQRREWPGLDRVLRAMSGETVRWPEKAPPAPEDGDWHEVSQEECVTRSFAVEHSDFETGTQAPTYGLAA
jgi:hypothetical protein